MRLGFSEVGVDGVCEVTLLPSSSDSRPDLNKGSGLSPDTRANHSGEEEASNSEILSFLTLAMLL